MNYFERWWTDYANRVTTAGELEKAAAKAAYFEALKLAHVTILRGESFSKTKFVIKRDEQLWWKGRESAANDIRALTQ